MLVQFCKGFTMEGVSTVDTYKHWWSRPKKVRQTIYLHTGVSGICDEADVEKEVERLTAKELASTHGWGEDFSGWQRVVPYEELLKIAEERGWKDRDFATGKIRTEPVNKWKMEKILKELTGEQFAQYSRENNVCLKGV
jgi:hypothetical protein